MIYLYLVSLVIECISSLPLLWRARYVFAGLAVALAGTSAVGIYAQFTNWLGLGIMIVTVFRLFNLFRIIKGRMHQQYLRRSVVRTSFWLLVYQLVLVTAWILYELFGTDRQSYTMYGWLVLVTSIMVLLITIRNVRKSRHVPLSEYYADRDLPTVTVAVPARNETTDLEDMIRTVLASNYPKLEIIVLDDCSGDETPDIIRQFAQDGVRFVPGDEPDERWLAKNKAYEELAKEANGELVLFAGVDVRFGPEAIRALVVTLLTRKKSMISVLPRRLFGSSKDAILQPMRYWWELTLPRRPFNRPAVLSTCWIIRKKMLKQLGGFEAVSHAIIPEGYFARELVKEDGYSFIRADDELDIQTRKSAREQLNTALRMHYPQFRRRPEWVLLAAFVHFVFLMLPLGIALSGLWFGFDLLRVLTGLSTLLLVLTHVLIVQISNPTNTLVALLNLPIAAISELLVTLVSMYRYEFSVIEWKGRNICVPVMHVVPHLPRLTPEEHNKGKVQS